MTSFLFAVIVRIIIRTFKFQLEVKFVRRIQILEHSLLLQSLLAQYALALQIPKARRALAKVILETPKEWIPQEFVNVKNEIKN